MTRSFSYTQIRCGYSMQRLAALVPRPRMHLIRYHGVLAPNAKWWSHIVSAAPIPDGNAAESADEEKKAGYYIHFQFRF